MTPAALLQTLTATFSELGTVSVGTTSLMECVYTDIGFNTSQVGAVIQIPISVPVNAQVVKTTGMGYVAPTYNGYSLNQVNVTLDTQLHYGTFVPNIDQINTDVTVRESLTTPAIAAIAEAANGCIAAALTTTNFNINPVVSTTASIVTPAQFVKGGLTTLVNRKVAGVRNPNFMSFIQHPNVNGSIIVDDAWTKAMNVGDAIAQQARLEAKVPVAFGAKIMVDQQMPATGVDPSQVFTSAYLSKYALAAAYRPVPLGDPRTTYSSYVNWKGLTIRIELSYLGKDQGWYLSVDAVMGVVPVRKEQCVIFSTAQ